VSNTVINVEGLSKRYQLGTIGYGSLQHDLKAWWAKTRGKEDPNAKIGEKSRLDLHGEFWALRDVGFEVQKGDRVGIIGRNGAGKSTLLKLLSRVTSPTTGSIKVKGRIASLLEVGTGFHPELTGRENVFLNGAILGMKRREIQAKFDEILGFSGVEKFIDTPVKRYSSGMYVRLAFSVAAHLDSEILILDEVLAVGDAEFQRKCLEKIRDVSISQGKTIILVSHHIQTLLGLCNSGVYLKEGRLFDQGTIEDVAWSYNHSVLDGRSNQSLRWENTLEANMPEGYARVNFISIVGPRGEAVSSTLLADKTYSIEIDLVVNKFHDQLSLFVTYSYNGQIISVQDCYRQPGLAERIKAVGHKKISVDVPKPQLMDKDYEVEVSLVIHNLGWSLPPQSGQSLRFTNVSGWQHPLRYEHSDHPLTGSSDPTLLLTTQSWSVEELL